MKWSSEKAPPKPKPKNPVKVKALKTTHGKEGLKKRGEVYNVSNRRYKELHDDKVKRGKRPIVEKVAERKTKEEKTAYNDKSVEQNGSWFYVYQNGKQIDKFQGRNGLKKHGLSE